MAAASQPTVGILPEEADLHTAEARVNKHKADWRGWKFMWPFTVVFVFVFIIPIVYAVYISFFKKQMIGGTRFVGVENYARLLQDGQFWSSVGRVALFTCVQVPIMLFLSAAMALALDSMKLHGAKFFRISTFLPYAVPAVVSTLVWGFVYGAKYGLVGSFNDFFGTNVDVLQPGVLLASIGNISTWEITGSLITIIPLVIAFLCLQKYWRPASPQAPSRSSCYSLWLSSERGAKAQNRQTQHRP